MLFGLDAKWTNKLEERMDIDAKLRPLYLLRILKEQSDGNHKLSTAQLCKQLRDEYGIETFRTTIKSDIEVLQQAGYDIEVTRSSQNQYCYVGSDFDSRELKALMDAVLSSDIIQNGMRAKVVGKLEKLGGPFKVKELKRNWVNSCYRHATDVPIDDIIEALNEAINKKRKILFLKYKYNVKKDRVVDNDGKPYTISPYYLTIADNSVYVIGRADNQSSYCSHRLDQFLGVPEILEEPAEPMILGIGSKVQSVPFGIDSEIHTEVELQADNSLMGDILDKFGPTVSTYACDQNSFRVIAVVGIGKAFYQWVFGFQGKIKVRSPETICREYESMIRKVSESIHTK